MLIYIWDLSCDFAAFFSINKPQDLGIDLNRSFLKDLRFAIGQLCVTDSVESAVEDAEEGNGEMRGKWSAMLGPRFFGIFRSAEPKKAMKMV